MWEINLTIEINFISSKDNDEERVMHSKGVSKEIMIKDKTNEVIKTFLNHFFLDIKLG